MAKILLSPAYINYEAIYFSISGSGGYTHHLLRAVIPAASSRIGLFSEVWADEEVFPET
jgi:hypothetical protein